MGTVRACRQSDMEVVWEIINDGAEAYRGVIPADRWHEPYMGREELAAAVRERVVFYGWEEAGELVGVMGIQEVQEVTLIRHAYVRTAWRGRGIGGELLKDLRSRTQRPVLIGAWAAATWAIRFYQKHGFRLVAEEEKAGLLRKYWGVPERQIETSVVLGDAAWFAGRKLLARETDDREARMMDPLSNVVKGDQFAREVGIEVVEVSPGRAVARLQVEAKHFNGVGVVHGGAIFALADYVFALACNSRGMPAVGINASIAYVKAAKGGMLTAEGMEIGGEGKMGTCTVKVTDEAGDLVALFQGLAYRKMPRG